MLEIAAEKFESSQVLAPWINPGILRSLRMAAWVAACLAAAIALLTIAGWILVIPALKHPFDASSLQSATAIDVVLWAVSLFLLSSKNSPQLKIAGRIIAAIVCITAALNVAEHWFEVDLGLAFPLWEPKDGDALSYPGHIAPDVAFCLVLLSASTFLFDLKDRKRRYLYKLLCLLAILPNIIILGCCAAGLSHICISFGCARVSAITSTVILLAGFAILFAKPAEGITAPFTFNTSGGRLLRSIFCGLAALIPLLALVQAGEVNGMYDQPIAYGIMVVMLISLFAGCTAWGAQKMDTIEAERTHAVQLLQDSVSNARKAPQRSYKTVCLQCAKEFSSAMTNCPDDGTELTRLTDRLSEGGIFAEKYEIVRFIGSGGISTIYLARHLHMNRNVALKLLKGNYSTDTKCVQRFQRESQATCKLIHPNIVSVFDFGISQEGQPYIIMDYLDGASLSECIQKSGAIAWQKSLAIFIQICEALEYAHENGVLHRDLKPANIMLIEQSGKTPVAKIVDFGLAKTLESSAELTKTGELLGSPTYMSPEQCRGEQADVRSDIYCLGSLMYECVAGRPAIVATNVYETIMLQISGPMPEIPAESAVPPWLENCILKAMAKEPAQRQQSATELLTELRAGFVSPIGI